MTYAVRYRIGPGPLAPLLHRVVSPSRRTDMHESMVNLADLIVAEGPDD